MLDFTQVYQKRRKLLQQELGSTVFVLKANSKVQKSLDLDFPFYQDNNFWYLTGLNFADLILVLSPKEEFLILAPKTRQELIFEGDYPIEEIKNTSGINQIYPYREGIGYLGDILSSSQEISTVNQKLKRGQRINIISQQSWISSLRRINPRLKINDVLKILARMRMVKDELEISCIQEAVRITKNALKEIEKDIYEYKNTSQIERHLLSYFISHNSSGHSFEPIIASGINATTIHFSSLNRPIIKNELLLLDVGASFNRYNADISRTIQVGKPNQQKLDLLNAVKNVQKELIKSLKPGLSFQDLEKRAEELIFEVLVNFKILNKKQFKKLRKYYPHSIGHSLGLDVHDLADYSLFLQENMVITVEPGIYLPNEGIGVRIEDDLLITKQGSKTL